MNISCISLNYNELLCAAKKELTLQRHYNLYNFEEKGLRLKC